MARERGSGIADENGGGCDACVSHLHSFFFCFGMLFSDHCCVFAVPVEAGLVLHSSLIVFLSGSAGYFIFVKWTDRTSASQTALAWSYSRLQLYKDGFRAPNPQYTSGWSAGVFDHATCNVPVGTRNHLSCNREYSRLQLRWLRVPVFQHTSGWSKTPANHPEVYRGPVARKPS